jgi:enediyne core biosynthesis thioesterase
MSASVAAATPFFEYRHQVLLDETSVAGNVYFARYIAWQGRCREMFLVEHAPEVVRELARGLSLATVRCSCDYYAELAAFDVVSVRMSLLDIGQTRVSMSFEYVRVGSGEPMRVARGEQEIASLRRQGDAVVPVRLPDALVRALTPFASPALRPSLSRYGVSPSSHSCPAGGASGRA